MKKKYLLKYISLGILLVWFDFLTKFLIKNFYKIETYNGKDILFLIYTKNMGSSFGIFSEIGNYNLFLILFSFFILFIFWYARRITFNKKNILFTTFFLSGLIGNLIDRIIYGYVIDFIGLKHLFVFNLADLYIFISFNILLYSELSDRTKVLKKVNIKKRDKKISN